MMSHCTAKSRTFRHHRRCHAGLQEPRCLAQGARTRAAYLRGEPSPREFARFLQLALASAHEVHYHLLLAHDLEFLPSAQFARLEARTEQVKKMLTGLVRHVRTRAAPSARAPSTVTRSP